MTSLILNISLSVFLEIRVFFHVHWKKGGNHLFILLYHFHPLTNIQTFICNFACEMTITYFWSHGLYLPDCYSMRFTTLITGVTIWLIDDVTLVFVCLRNDSILAFILQQLETGNWWTRTRIDYHSCITTEPTNQVCISCGSDNITKRTNKNTSRRLSVPLRHLYNQLQGMIIPPLCQDGLLIHVWQCVKMAALIDPKTAISEFSRFFWYNVICLSNHLYEKKLLLFPSTVCHLLVNDIVERDLEKKWPSGYYNKERNPYDFFVFTY